jgi:predicted nucleic acid-binding protein
MANTGREHRALLCDTNVFVRLLTDDPPDMAEACERALVAAGRGEFVAVLTDVVVTELAYVLVGPYGLQRAEAAERIGSLLDLRGVEVAHDHLIRWTLHVWSSHPIDFADAYLAALSSLSDDAGILSFDRDLDRIEDVHRTDPTEF